MTANRLFGWLLWFCVVHASSAQQDNTFIWNEKNILVKQADGLVKIQDLSLASGKYIMYHGNESGIENFVFPYDIGDLQNFLRTDNSSYEAWLDTSCWANRAQDPLPDGIWTQFIVVSSTVKIIAQKSTFTGLLNGPLIQYEHEGYPEGWYKFKNGFLVDSSYTTRAGKLETKVFYTAQCGRDSIAIAYTPDGVIARLYDEEMGVALTFFENGTLESITQFAHGLPNGKRRHYSAVGVARSIEYFRLGRKLQ